MERLVENGYIKMIAIDVSDLESKIVNEKNTNYLCDVERFQKDYSNKRRVKCLFIHMDDKCDVNFVDYQKIHKHIHPFDYVRDVIKRNDGKFIEGSDYLHVTHKKNRVKLNAIDLKK